MGAQLTMTGLTDMNGARDMSDVRTPQLPAPSPAAWPPPVPAATPSPTGTGTDRPGVPREPGLDRSDISPTPLPSRPLWMIAGTVLLLGSMFWGCFQIVSVLSREQWDSSYREPAAGITTLRIDGDNGRITVRGADTDEITVRAEVSRGLFGIDESAERVGDRYVVSADCPPLGNEWCSVEYDVVVPRGMDLEIDAENGSATISDIDGSIDVSSNNGRVELRDVTGSVIARSNNGRVIGTGLSSPSADVGSDNGRVELAFVEAPETVEVSTDNGSVDIAVPDVEGDYAVVAEAANGSTNIEVTSDPNSPRTVSASADNGSITVRYPE